MRFTALQLVSFLLLLIALVCIITALSTNHWEHRDIVGRDLVGSLKGHRGLLVSCHECRLVCNLFQAQECHSRLASIKVDKDTYDVSYKTLQAWEVAVLALMVASAFLGFVTLLSSCFCCNRCPMCLVVLLSLATLCAVIGVSVYAAKCGTGESNPLEKLSKHSTHTFGWSFWLAVGGACTMLLSTFCFCCVSRQNRSGSHAI